ncbi:twin-arginine translocation signal domain-containing protein, partial [Brevundimonas sp.]
MTTSRRSALKALLAAPAAAGVASVAHAQSATPA